MAEAEGIGPDGRVVEAHQFDALHRRERRLQAGTVKAEADGARHVDGMAPETELRDLAGKGALPGAVTRAAGRAAQAQRHELLAIGLPGETPPLLLARAVGVDEGDRVTAPVVPAEPDAVNGAGLPAHQQPRRAAVDVSLEGSRAESQEWWILPPGMKQRPLRARVGGAEGELQRPERVVDKARRSGEAAAGGEGKAEAVHGVHGAGRWGQLTVAAPAVEAGRRRQRKLDHGILAG